MIDVQEVYPYLRVHNTSDAIEFYARAFDAKEQFRLTEPGGRIGHAGTVRDPFGHEWLLGGHLETLTSEEMQRRYTALFQK